MALVTKGLVTFLHAEGLLRKEAEASQTACLEEWLLANALDNEKAHEALGRYFSLPYKPFSDVWRLTVRTLEAAPRWELFEVGGMGFMLCVRPPSEAERTLYAQAYGDMPFFLTDAAPLQSARLVEKAGHGYTAGRNQARFFVLEDFFKPSAETVDALIGQILSAAAKMMATDVHLSPNTQGLVVRFRIFGEMTIYATLPLSQSEGLINKLKLLGDMDIAEHRLPQDGHFRFSYQGAYYNLRLGTLPLYDGEKMVLRLLPEKKRLSSLEDLGFNQAQREVLCHQLEKREGLVLLTGPTGSGKTTTLYACLRQLAEAGSVVYTIEDPLEALVDGVEQMQVNEKSGFGFAQGLRGMLRSDPDVLVVGELRDAETVGIAVRAALSGHLVLATLHAYDAHSSVSRLRDLGVSDLLLSAVLGLVVNQRLFAKPCPTCGGSGLDKGHYCAGCQGSGRVELSAAGELWLLDKAALLRIEQGESAEALRAQSLEKGFVPLAKDAVEKGLGDKV